MYQIRYHSHCAITVELDTALNCDSERLPRLPYGEQATPAHLGLGHKKRLSVSVCSMFGFAVMKMFIWADFSCTRMCVGPVGGCNNLSR